MWEIESLIPRRAEKDFNERLSVCFLTDDIIYLPAMSLETHFLKKIDMASPADCTLFIYKNPDSDMYNYEDIL